MTVASPKPVHLGVGVSDGAVAADLIALAEHALQMAGGRVIGLATLDSRLGHPAVVALSGHLGMPIQGFAAAALESLTPRLLNPSEAVFRLTGCHGVAEAAALASAGETARLVVGKMKSGYATVALASG